MNESKYNSEDFFQKLLADHPDLLAGSVSQYDEQRRWLLIARETPIPDKAESTGRWSLDHFFIDQDAIPTFVEVKRSTDTRIRREVIGQMFDYAANAVSYWTTDSLEQYFKKTCLDIGVEPDQVLIEYFGDDRETESIWGDIHTNLRANRLRLVFVADELPPELIRIIEFMNETMPNIDVLGIVVKQYIGVSGKAYVPQVVGYTAIAAAQKTDSSKGPGIVWDANRFRMKLSQSDIQGLPDLFDRLLEWATKISKYPIWWGKGKKNGCFALAFMIESEKLWPVYFYTGENGNGYVQLSFANLSKHELFEPDAARINLLHKFNEISGISIPEDRINAWPSFPMSVLLDSSNFDAFLSIIKNIEKFGIKGNE